MTDPRPSAGDLAQIAEKATPGQWELDTCKPPFKPYRIIESKVTEGVRGQPEHGGKNDHVYIAEASGFGDGANNNAVHIAAANPATVLALLADWRLFRKFVEARWCSCHLVSCDRCDLLRSLRVRD